MRIYLKELSKHKTAGNFDSIDLECRSRFHDGVLAGVGSQTQYHWLSGAQELVIHLRDRHREEKKERNSRERYTQETRS